MKIPSIWNLFRKKKPEPPQPTNSPPPLPETSVEEDGGYGLKCLNPRIVNHPLYPTKLRWESVDESKYRVEKAGVTVEFDCSMNRGEIADDEFEPWLPIRNVYAENKPGLSMLQSLENGIATQYSESWSKLTASIVVKTDGGNLWYGSRDTGMFSTHRTLNINILGNGKTFFYSEELFWMETYWHSLGFFEPMPEGDGNIANWLTRLEKVLAENPQSLY